jgi:glycerol-3-phosphate dehydrogenase
MDQRPILILGGGINGAALARELVLNGVNVWLVDANDLSFGATAYSSRLIHGGLRYLEFAEFSLVKESLHERARLLKLAPHLVRPLRLFIPVKNRFGGLLQSAGKFLRVPLGGRKPRSRGLHVVQMGLWMYDLYSRGGGLPRRSLHRPGDVGVPAVSGRVARRLWAYSDAQIVFPERLVIDFLTDARQIAQQKGLDFRVLTYHQAQLAGTTAEISPADHARPGLCLTPAAIVNATGAWVDATLARLPAPSKRLMGGTKGSHFLTFQPRLAELLRGQAVYAEARDGRPVFLLPFRDGTLIGTTDIPFEGDPATAVATEPELEYLLSVANDLFPEARLTRGDIAMHQCGVRPLPYVDATTPAAITRRHLLVWNDEAPLPLLSLVGGKLTTCRSLAEEATLALLRRLGRSVLQTSRERPIPPTPIDETLINTDAQQIVSPETVRYAVEHEWATRLEDLIERRFMLHFSRHLSPQALADAAAALVQLGKLQPQESAPAIGGCMTRLKSHFGIQLTTDN